MSNLDKRSQGRKESGEGKSIRDPLICALKTSKKNPNKLKAIICVCMFIMYVHYKFMICCRPMKAIVYAVAITVSSYEPSYC